jgi:hypothetical protein
MNPKTKAPCLVLLLAVTAVQAQTAMPKSRDEVRQELAEAVRSGTLAQGESGLPLRELFPYSYPQSPKTAGRTQAEVRAELEAARISGDLLADGESSLRRNELYPAQYPQRVVVAGKSRAQVKSELAAAQRSGDIVATGESGLTLKEIQPGLYLRASTPAYAGAPMPEANQVTR